MVGLEVLWVGFTLTEEDSRNWDKIPGHMKNICGRDWGQEEKGMTEDEMAG